MKFINKISTPLLFILAVVQTNVNAKVTAEEAANWVMNLPLLALKRQETKQAQFPHIPAA